MKFLLPPLSTYRNLFPGTLTAVTVGVAATFLSSHYGGPTMLYALLLGMAFYFLSSEGPCAEGIRFTSTTVLRVGVALLGLRITSGQIVSLGAAPLMLVVGAIAATILFGWILSRWLGMREEFGILTGAAVAICGASAAMAVSAILPKHEDSERDTLFAVLGITCLSTLAMIIYPMLVAVLGLHGHQAGIFLGGTIHDVAQVVVAGYSISPETGDTATIVKLMRVAMLLPVSLVVAWRFRHQHAANESQTKRPRLLPTFLIVFAILVIINSMVKLPTAALQNAGELSRWCLVSAIAAIGMKTSLQSLAKIGLRPVLLIVGETAILAMLVVAPLLWSGHV
ncbi:membrane protein [Pandoraea terrae]|uniref:Membrane protein n=1 Tax=Pandoraea terrae TaxID=1537710 RepID=A0A5E4WCZ7_9BURK|nr:YeiH family protein [Pandoraea terrae]VVE21659.1 membrane protein [Pandoraea terrae]